MTGELYHVSRYHLNIHFLIEIECSITESMAGHRAHRLLAVLQNALAFGYSEIEPHPEPLKVSTVLLRSY